MGMRTNLGRLMSMGTLRNRTVWLAAALISVGFSAPAAQAQPPTRTDISVPAGTSFVFNDPAADPDTICEFPLEATFVEDREWQTTFSDGSFVITGALKIRFTNVNSGASIDLNVSGPARGTPNADGSYTEAFAGRSLIFPTGTNLMMLTSGRTVMTFDPTVGSYGLVSAAGASFDICSALS